MSRSTAKTVRLGELDYDPVVLAMPGQEARLEKVDDLVASIGAEGVLQSLKVRTSPDADRYLVTAGLRRLTALQQLRNEHGTILGEPVTNETLVPVVYSEESDDAARRQAVAENVQRVALTVGAEVKQFAELAKTMPNKEIAARFGVTEKRVAQRLKLAGLHSDVLEALDAGKIKIATAEAFTLEEDPDKQAKYLKKNLNNSYNLEPYRIREAFTKKLVSAGSAIARHIGEDDYAAAGGETFADPFSDAVYWISEDLIERLAAERTTALVEAWKAEGWAFVETVDEFGKTDWGYPKVWQARRIDHGESEDGEPVPFTAEQKALSGVVYWPDAEHAPEFGVVKAGTVLPGDDEPKAPPPPDFWRPGGDVSQVLQRALGEAVASKVEADPLVALRLLVAQLAFTMVANGNGWSSIVHINGNDVREGAEFGVECGSDYAEIRAWVEAQDEPTLLQHLAKLVSLSIRLRGSVDGTAGEQLTLINPDTMAAFDAEAYFGAIGKPLVALAYEDITGKKLKDGKLEKMAGTALVEAKAQGWLPPQLRTAHYAGPCHVTPPAAAEDEADPADEWDEDEELEEDELDESERQAAE